MEEDGTFIHQSLAEDSIRLLHIAAIEPEIIGELRHFLLDEAPPYEALSYCWGSPMTTRHLNLVSGVHHITANLHEALRCTYTTLQPAWLWVDAISISQISNAEKSQQVALMWKIFNKAQRVIIWLGGESADSNIAMSAISVLSQKPAFFGAYEEDDFDQIPHEDLERVGFPLPEDGIWSFCLQIFCRGWFRRLWVVQEAILARDIIVVCGLRTIEWDQLISMISILRSTQIMKSCRASYNSNISPTFGDVMRDIGVLKMVDLVRKRKLQYPFEPAIVHTSIFDLVLDKETSEPVDRVYSLLGILDDNFRSQIVVDYSAESRSQNWTTVYASFFKILLQKPGGLYIWERLSERSRAPGLPSWCPNLNGSEVSLKHWSSTKPAAMLHSSSVQGLGFTEHESRPDALRVCGQRIDRIVRVIPFAQESCAQISDRIIAILQQERNTRDALAQFPGWSTWDEDNRSAYVRTLIGNTIIRLDPQQSNMGLASFIRPFKESMALFESSLRSNASTLTLAQFAQLYVHSLTNPWRGRIFMVTETGRVGMGPFDSRPGDLICTIPGFHMPMIMSFARHDAEEDLWEFVGSAFLDRLTAREIFGANDSKEQGKTYVVI